MRVGSLFAGIGGFDLGLEWAGMIPTWQVENDGFCQKVLAKHWPDVRRYGDIHDFITECEKGNVEYAEVITGGFPCQPFSYAGKRKSQKDDRYLWPAMCEVVSILRPSWVIGENVAGIVRMALDQVLSDLENEGYACQTFIIPACGVDTPHRRDRVWIVADSKGRESRKSKAGGRRESSCGRGQDVADSCLSRLQGATCERFECFPTEAGQSKGGATGRRVTTQRRERSAQSRLGGMVDGLSSWLDEPVLPRVARGIPNRVNRLKALGNAVVPQIPYIIGQAIMEVEGL